MDKNYILKKFIACNLWMLIKVYVWFKQPCILFFIGICLRTVYAQELHHNMELSRKYNALKGVNHAFECTNIKSNKRSF